MLTIIGVRDVDSLEPNLRARNGERETRRLTGLRLRDRLRRRRGGVLLRRRRGGLPRPLLRRGGVGDLRSSCTSSQLIS